MRMVIQLVAAALAVLSPLAAQDTPTSVSVTVAGTRAHAVDLASAALTTRGYSIATASEYAVVTAPGAMRGGMSKFRLTIHATIAAVGADSARVTLSAIATAIGSPFMQLQPASASVTVKHKPEYRELQAIRDAVGVAAAGQTAPGHG